MANPLKLDPGTALLLSCEHATCAVPAPYTALFASATAQAALHSHRGWDPHALTLARSLQAQTGAPLHTGTATRLLVELNRSPHHPQLWSEFSRDLPHNERALILRTLYFPYRQEVVRSIRDLLRTADRVLHLSVHSFTSVWNDVPRPLDLGLLFDPARPAEQAWANRYHAHLADRHPHLRLAFNAPYSGADDGLTTALRQHFPPFRYLGIELEWNQALSPIL